MGASQSQPTTSKASCSRRYSSHAEIEMLFKAEIKSIIQKELSINSENPIDVIHTICAKLSTPEFKDAILKKCSFSTNVLVQDKPIEQINESKKEDKLEQVETIEQVEQVEPVKTIEPVIQVEHLEQVESVVQLEPVDESKSLEQVESIVQLEPVEESKSLEQVSPIVQLAQIEPMTRTEQLEQHETIEPIIQQEQFAASIHP